MQGAALTGNSHAMMVLMFIHATAVIAVLMHTSAVHTGAVDVRDSTIGVTMGVGDSRHDAGELGDKKEPNEPGNKLVPAPKQHNNNLLPTGNGNLAGFSHAVNAMETRRQQICLICMRCAFASSIRSWTISTGADGCTTRAMGAVPAKITGQKPRSTPN